MSNAATIGEELLTYVKNNEDCLDISEFFEYKNIYGHKFIAANIENDEFFEFYQRAKEAIGRKYLKTVFKSGKATPFMEKLVRFQMADFNTFVEDCVRREWKDRQAAQMAKADETIDRLANFMDNL